MNETSPTVSVVIPAFNASATLGAVLEAVLDQERPSGVSLEVIVADDGSNDDTVACARGYSGVQLVEGGHLGAGGARNRGASRASGDVLVFLDSDDRPLDGWLRQIAEAFADDRVGFASWPAHVTELTAGSATTKIWYPDRHGPDGVLVIPGCFGLRRSVFVDIEGYDPVLRVGENSDLCRRARARCDELGLETRRLREVTYAITFRNSAAHYDRYRLEAIEHLLLRDADDYAEDSARRSQAHAIAAVNAGRCGEWRRARRHALLAVQARPRRARGYGRVVLAWVPPLGRRFWAAEQRRSRISSS